MACQIILNIFPKLLFFPCSRSNDQLNKIICTLAVEILMVGFASSLSMSEN